MNFQSDIVCFVVDSLALYTEVRSSYNYFDVPVNLIKDVVDGSAQCHAKACYRPADPQEVGMSV